MKQISSHRLAQISKLLPLLGLIFGIIFWIVDAVLHHYVFHIEDSVIGAMLSKNLEEIWMRSFIVVLFIGLGFMGSLLYSRVAKAKNTIEKTNILMQKEIQARQKLEDDLRKQATTDFLTGLFSRRYFFEQLDKEMERSLRSKSSFSILLCDIDDFKSINDSFGHAVGDRVLKTFASSVSGVIRKVDVFARYGGEEFIVLAPDTALKSAAKLAEKIRKETETLLKFNKFQVTVSIGVSQFHRNDIPDELIQRADLGLYDAKKKGKNQVAVKKIQK
ncbi:MAG: GGDEF domain-containing protein [Leptospirales bacterium]